MSTSNTQLTNPVTRRDIRALIQTEQVQQQLAMALPRFYAPDQFTVIVRTAINRNPKLGECDATSFLTAMLTAAQMGILPNGRDGHLIPRWNGKQQRMECTFQPDYKGIVGLIRRNDSVADIYAVCVRKGDEFKITQGLHRDIVHVPNYDDSPGEIIGVYAVILFKSGLSTWEYLPRTEVESIRARSESWKAHVDKGYDTPWKTDEGEMFKKTAIKRVSKLADLSPETMDRIMADPDITFERPAEAREVKAAVIPTPESPSRCRCGFSFRREVKAAVIPTPESPALPEPTDVEPGDEEAEQKLVKGKEVKSAPKEKKSVLIKKKAEPVGEPEGNPKVQEIRDLLEKGGYTDEQFTRVLREFAIFDGDTTLDKCDQNVLDSIIEYWDEVEAELSKDAKK